MTTRVHAIPYTPIPDFEQVFAALVAGTITKTVHWKAGPRGVKLTCKFDGGAFKVRVFGANYVLEDGLDRKTTLSPEQWATLDAAIMQ